VGVEETEGKIRRLGSRNRVLRGADPSSGLFLPVVGRGLLTLLNHQNFKKCQLPSLRLPRESITYMQIASDGAAMEGASRKARREIPRDALTLDAVLGSGSFGMVYRCAHLPNHPNVVLTPSQTFAYPNPLSRPKPNNTLSLSLLTPSSIPSGQPHGISPSPSRRIAQCMWGFISLRPVSYVH
jgi:hypothetical protein